MRLTLTLHDYLDKYMDIVSTGQTWCPICYESAFELNRGNDIRHLIGCYKELKLELNFRNQVSRYGEVKNISKALLKYIDDVVEDEMMVYHLKYSQQQDDDQI